MLSSLRLYAFEMVFEKYSIKSGISLILLLNGSILIWKTFNLWNKSSLKFPRWVSLLIFLLDVQIILTFTLISWLLLILLNFWSIRTLNIFDWVSRGISEISSINKVPPEAFSSEPYVIEPFSFSSPKSSSSYFLTSSTVSYTHLTLPTKA